jgi:hypothetical protein
MYILKYTTIDRDKRTFAMAGRAAYRFKSKRSGLIKAAFEPVVSLSSIEAVPNRTWRPKVVAGREVPTCRYSKGKAPMTHASIQMTLSILCVYKSGPRRSAEI